MSSEFGQYLEPTSPTKCFLRVVPFFIASLFWETVLGVLVVAIFMVAINVVMTIVLLPMVFAQYFLVVQRFHVSNGELCFFLGLAGLSYYLMYLYLRRFGLSAWLIWPSLIWFLIKPFFAVLRLFRKLTLEPIEAIEEGWHDKETQRLNVLARKLSISSRLDSLVVVTSFDRSISVFESSFGVVASVDPLVSVVLTDKEIEACLEHEVGHLVGENREVHQSAAKVYAITGFISLEQSKILKASENFGVRFSSLLNSTIERLTLRKHLIKKIQATYRGLYHLSEYEADSFASEPLELANALKKIACLQIFEICPALMAHSGRTVEILVELSQRGTDAHPPLSQRLSNLGSESSLKGFFDIPRLVGTRLNERGFRLGNGDVYVNSAHASVMRVPQSEPEMTKRWLADKNGSS